MAETKITKKDNFNAIITILEENDRVDLADVMRHEIELIEKKNANRKSKTVDNSGFYEAVEEALSSGAMTPTELAKAIGVDTPQKVTAILKGMADKVVKETKGKKVTYRLA